MQSVMHVVILFMIYMKSMTIWKYIYELKNVFLWRLYVSKPLTLLVSYYVHIRVMTTMRWVVRMGRRLLDALSGPHSDWSLE